MGADPSRLAGFVLAATGALALGCAGSDRMKKEIATLQTELTTLRADQDRLEERLAAMELAASVASRAARAPAPERVERPRLKVIHLAPDDPAEISPPEHPADAPASSARPVIRGTGDRLIKIGDDGAPPAPRSGLAVSPAGPLASGRGE